MTYPNYEKGGTGMLPTKPTREKMGGFRIATLVWTTLWFVLIAKGCVDSASTGAAATDAGALGAAFGIGFFLFIWTGGMVALALLKFMLKK